MMKPDDKCVKCGSVDLITVPIVPGEGPHIAVGERILHAVPVKQIVCGTCGYIEAWVNGEEHLSKLKEAYGRQP